MRANLPTALIVAALSAGCAAPSPAAPLSPPPAPTSTATVPAEAPATAVAQTLSPPTAPASTATRPAAPSATGAVTIGAARDGRSAGLTAGCRDPRTPFTPARIGSVTDGSGRAWTVPAAISPGDTGVALYDDCAGAGNHPDWASQLKTVVVDPDGVEITAYLHADNYFELYVNGKFVCRDTIGFTPFNSSACRFRAKYPITVAIRAVDWEEHLGVGLEYDRFNVGDGGIVATFSNGVFTDGSWKAESFYFAPLDDPACVRATPAGRDASSCPIRPACVSNNPTATCKALHFAEPDGWTQPGFDDSAWPVARVYTAQEFGPKEAYNNYASLFGPGRFIWTRNLNIDNLVLLRKTMTAPR